MSVTYRLTENKPVECPTFNQEKPCKRWGAYQACHYCKTPRADKGA